MERFTHESDGYYAVSNDSCYEDQNEEYSGPAIERLAAYEDTGLEPEEIMEAIKINGGKAYELPTVFGESFEHIRELIEAEKEGRLVVLPF